MSGSKDPKNLNFNLEFEIFVSWEGRNKNLA